VKEGLRTVGPDQFKSGHTLDAGELALGPEIRFDVVQDPVLLAAAARLETSPRILGVTQPSQVAVREIFASNRNGVGCGRWSHIDGFSENVIRYIQEIEARD
jgi:hypothetical protein